MRLSLPQWKSESALLSLTQHLRAQFMSASSPKRPVLHLPATACSGLLAVPLLEATREQEQSLNTVTPRGRGAVAHTVLPSEC